MPTEIAKLLAADINKLVAVSWWNRIEPRPRAPEVADTVAAKVRDPLWMLTRQWQFGELQGEDAASPAWIQMSGSTTEFMGWRPADAAPATPLAPMTAPLEEMVETEAFSPDLSVQAECGLLLDRLLEDQGLSPAQRTAVLAAVRDLFPLDAAGVEATDQNALRFAEVCRDRAVDGARLVRDGATPALLAKPAVAPLATEVTAAVAALQAEMGRTLGDLGGDTGAAWRVDRLEYDVDVAVAGPDGGAMMLAAHPDRDATFEWYTMDLRGREPESAPGAPAPKTFKSNCLPAFVRFRGMPNHRFWDFERGASDFGSVIPDKRDLAKLLVMDFMLIHGNDFFVVPFEQPVGTAARIDQLLVHDVFGGVTLVERADAGQAPAGARWSCFSTSMLDQEGRPADFFLLPPSAGAARLVGEQIEDVRIVRDEQANLVWGIEQMTEGGDGRPWLGRERHVASTQGELPQVFPPTTAPLQYRLQSFVPWHWFPMLPVSLDQFTGQIALERGQMVRPDGVTSPVPLGRLLHSPPSVPYRLREETVPRTGLRITREVVRTRWHSGETHVWIARRKLVGRGEGSSGLRYDEARPVIPPTP